MPKSKNTILFLLNPLCDHVHTMTSDNGKEFVRLETIVDVLNADFYFAHSYTSWVRGLNGNINALILQYFIKGCYFTAITQKEIQTVMDKLNNRS
ncbi:MAG: IS30 family transposase [Candidatus Thiodiazotropha sp. (ex Lucinoma borealis)]|nr:IS30 family transposase [Candidatus Thiodiazotropha sp. (ex Lucinoma borealis)]MCU7867393.1 IS30 family transposase [Candidatus Thiodiazotropha sp. (ex Lucinoma borealis)]